MWVSPFGYPRIKAYLRLPVAFRSLSRPSSAPGAKAFPLRSFLLDLLYVGLARLLLLPQIDEYLLPYLPVRLPHSHLFSLSSQYLFMQFSRCPAGFLPRMGSSRLELPTSRLSGARSNHLSYEPVWLSLRSFHLSYGDEQIRTVDPLLARQVLSHLSYTPIQSLLESDLFLFLLKGSHPLN